MTHVRTCILGPATRNALLWRVPGQRHASQGLNTRFVETIDIFPTIVELVGLQSLPTCAGIDQPPTTLCVQGESYAAEFLPPRSTSESAPPPSASASASATATATATTVSSPSPPSPKQYAFSQWPFPAWGNETQYRQGYTVRSTTGYRYTTYVPYNLTSFRGDWSAPLGDEELYDYTRDKWETTNWARAGNYSAVLAELRQVLRQQYTRD